MVRGSTGGLSDADAAQRLAADGPNRITSRTTISVWTLLAAQFASVLIWTLIAAGAISFAVGEPVDGTAIIAIVILNAAMGFAQEFSAARSIAALQSLTAPDANVRRAGKSRTIPAFEVVVGDVLLLDAGDVIAADARLLQSASLRCVESTLTGESDAVIKSIATLPAGDIALGDQDNVVFMGTSVAGGTGEAIVVATGMRTALGQIAELLDDSEAARSTPLQTKLARFGRVLVWSALGVVAVHFALGLWRGIDVLTLFMTSVSLAVAAVPEGLPAVVTVALALGVRRMARQRALVRTLAAVETLGSTSVICTDKTGTLTMGEMTARALYVDDLAFDVSGEGYGPVGEVHLAEQSAARTESVAAPLHALGEGLFGCNSAQLSDATGSWHVVGDPTEGAMLSAGGKVGVDQAQLEREQPIVFEIPFDSDRKRSTMIRHQPDGTLTAYVNGAPGVLLTQCTHLWTAVGVRALTEDDRTRILGETSRLASRALRVLGSARRTLPTVELDDAEHVFTVERVERDLTFVGLVGMYDPPRPEGKAAIQQCRDAGIRVVMMTGDHPETAIAIARELGIATGSDAAVAGISLNALDEVALAARVRDVSVFSRVSAEHKLRVVRAWQANDAIVAMTGDGVNDAPAVRGADIGIAMGRTGTDVTKQAADMIITDDHFATIVTAVAEGRGVYDNIRKTLQYLLAGNTGELLLMTVCVVFALPTPLLPIHLLWINLVTDGLPAFCLATDAIDPAVMGRAPRRRSAPLTDRRFVWTMLMTGALTAAVTLAVYLYMRATGRAASAQTYAFTVLVFAELLRAFGARSERRFVWRIRPWFSRPLALAVTASITFQLFAWHSPLLASTLRLTPLPLADGLLLLAVGAIPLVAMEFRKA